MNNFKIILYFMLIFIILIYIFIFFSYKKDEIYTFKKKKKINTTPCLLNSCDKHYYFAKSEDQ